MHPMRGDHRLGSVVLNRTEPTRFRTPDLHNLNPQKAFTHLSTHSAGLEPSPTASEGSSVSSVSTVHSGQGQLPPSGRIPDTVALNAYEKLQDKMETMAKNIRKKMQKNKWVGADELEAMGDEEIFSKAVAILKEKNISFEGPKAAEHGAVFASRVHTKFMTFLTEI